jgi:hypothetical protein
VIDKTEFEKLAAAAGLKVRRYPGDELVIEGKRGRVVEWFNGRFTWLLLFERAVFGPDGRRLSAGDDRPPGTTFGPWPRISAALKNRARLDPLLRLEDECDEEAIFSFAPGALAHVARRWCRCRFRRRISEETRARLARLSSAGVAARGDNRRKAGSGGCLASAGPGQASGTRPAPGRETAPGNPTSIRAKADIRPIRHLSPPFPVERSA